MNRQKPYTLYVMLVLAALWIAFFLCAPYIAPFDPETTSIADRLQDISSTHLLGTDQLGRDVWSRILYGGKASLGIAFTIIGISGAIGIAIGGLAGFSTPSIDRWLSRLIDLVLGFPNMVIAIAFIGIMGPSITNVIISLCITKWAEYARITRGLVQIERHAEYITFARMSGASNLRILWRYILPNVLPPFGDCYYSTSRRCHHFGSQFLAHRHRCATAGSGVGRYLVELPRFSTNGTVAANLPGARYFYYCCFI